MRKLKKHETPEFMVLREKDSNRKFFAASGKPFTSSNAPAATYTVDNNSTAVW